MLLRQRVRELGAQVLQQFVYGMCNGITSKTNINIIIITIIIIMNIISLFTCVL